MLKFLELEFNPSESAMKFALALKLLKSNAKNIILGCAGVVRIKDEFESITGYTAFDGVTSAAKLCRALV